MKKQLLYLAFVLAAFLKLCEPVDGKKVIIHVPYRIKNVKHTHTVYKVLPHQHHHHHRREKKDERVVEEESEEFDHF